jgi:hypothetical protein
MWKGSGRSLFQTLILENAKFILFVATPIFTASIFWNDKIVEQIVSNRQYVRYPPEGERPPVSEAELAERLREMAAAKATRAQAGSKS